MGKMSELSEKLEFYCGQLGINGRNKAIIMANFLDYSSFSMDTLENDLELMSEEFNLIVMAVDYDMAKDLDEVGYY